MHLKWHSVDIKNNSVQELSKENHLRIIAYLMQYLSSNSAKTHGWEECFTASLTRVVKLRGGIRCERVVALS